MSILVKEIGLFGEKSEVIILPWKTVIIIMSLENVMVC